MLFMGQRSILNLAADRYRTEATSAFKGYKPVIFQGKQYLFRVILIKKPNLESSTETSIFVFLT
jgi:hypothetical protein